MTPILLNGKIMTPNEILKKKINQLEKLNNEIKNDALTFKLNGLFWNCSYIDEHIRDLKECEI